MRFGVCAQKVPQALAQRSYARRVTQPPSERSLRVKPCKNLSNDADFDPCN